ncbi:hypothetical protein OY671_008805, partial [Metschnikowia pulcherrima]
ITTRFPAVHGAPVHFDKPEMIGIKDISKPDYGDAVSIQPDEVPASSHTGVSLMNRREVLLSGVASSSAGTVGTRAFAQAGGEISIGCIWPLTGPTAQIGADARHASETAVDIVNGSHDLDSPTAKNAGLAGLGNAKIKSVFADHQGDPQKGRAEAERSITQDKVVA